MSVRKARIASLSLLFLLCLSGMALISPKASGSAWPGQDVVAVPAPLFTREVLVLLGRHGATHPLSSLNQPYLFWDYGSLGSVPLADLEWRFLPGDSRLTDYATQLRAFFETNDGKTAFQLVFFDSGSIRDVKTMENDLQTAFPGSLMLRGKPETRSFFRLILPIALFLAVAFLSRFELRATSLAMVAPALALIRPEATTMMAMISVFFLVLILHLDEELRRASVGKGFKGKAVGIARVLISNWNVFLFLTPAVLLLFKGVEHLSFFILGLVIHGIIFDASGFLKNSLRKKSVFSFKPVKISSRSFRFSDVKAIYLIPCAVFLISYTLHGLFLGTGTTTTVSARSGSIPIPVPLPGNDGSLMPSLADFESHVKEQYRYEYTRVIGSEDPVPYRDFSSTDPTKLHVKILASENTVQFPPHGIPSVETLLKRAHIAGKPDKRPVDTLETHDIGIVDFVATLCFLAIYGITQATSRKKAGRYPARTLSELPKTA